MLEDVHSRLSGVVIECLPYREFIERYDRPYTLFYLDPPYHGCERDYGAGMFETEDFERLASCLKGLQGRFILSINDTAAMRRTFAGFTIRPVTTTYSLPQGRSKKARELIITG